MIYDYLSGPADPDLAAWGAYVAALRDQLAGDWARAEVAYSGLKKVREGLGLEFVDDSPQTEAGGAPSGAWTSDLEAEAENLQGMVKFTLDVLDDVSGNKRKLLWDGSRGYFVVEGLPDDLLRLELDSNGAPVLIDRGTGAATKVTGPIGLGIPPLVIVAGAVVGAVALGIPAYFIVDAATGALRDIAEQRTMQTIAKAQYDCVASGKCTAEQAQKLTGAVYAGAASVHEAKAKAEAQKPPSKWADAAVKLGWIALGLGALYAVVRFVPAPAGSLAAARDNPGGPRPQSGYAFEHRGRNWRNSRDESWDTVMFTPTGRERYIGTRYVDGAEVNVWVSDGRHIAQTVVMTGRLAA